MIGARWCPVPAFARRLFASEVGGTAKTFPPVGRAGEDDPSEDGILSGKELGTAGTEEEHLI